MGDWKRRTKPDEIDDVIEQWHGGAGFGIPLHEYLGWTWREYATWVRYGRIPQTCLDCGEGREAPGVTAICVAWHTGGEDGEDGG